MPKNSTLTSILKKILIFIGGSGLVLLMLIVALVGILFFQDRNYNPYQKREDGIYYVPQSPKFMSEARLEGVDEASFEALKCNYARDKNHVYHFAALLEGADPKSFKVGNCSLAKDKNKVYIRGNIVQGADPRTFILLNDYHGRDKDSIYAFDKPIKEADVKSFKVIKSDYAKDANNVYKGPSIIPNAQPKTFELIDSSYSRDGKDLYKNGKLVEGRDATTFERVHFENFTTIKRFTKDSTGLYLEDPDSIDQKLEGANPEAFELIKYQDDFGKDDQHLFYKYYRVEGVDVPSLEMLRNDYFKDKNGIYFVYEELASGNTITPQILEDADPETLEVDVKHFSWNRLAKTKDFVYFRGKKLEGVDTKSFWIFHPHYAKDKERVYGLFQEAEVDQAIVPLQGAEPWTFELLSETDDEISFAKDAKQVYSNGEIIAIEGIDAASVERLPYGFFKDSRTIYCQSEKGEWKILDGADPESFEFVYNGAVYSRDQDNFYHYCEPVEGFPEEVSKFIADPENALQMACGNTGGNWKLFDTDCANTCDAEERLHFHCQDLENYSCSCGPGNCWNGSSCVKFVYPSMGL